MRLLGESPKVVKALRGRVAHDGQSYLQKRKARLGQRAKFNREVCDERSTNSDAMDGPCGFVLG